MECVCVDPAFVAAIWGHVRPLLYEAITRGDLGLFGPVEQSVLQGRSLLWIATDGKTIAGAAITELTLTESRKVCVIVACGGNESSRWLHLIGKIEDYARDEKCDAVRVIGRKGWQRKLPDYAVQRVILEKDIDNGRNVQQ